MALWELSLLLLAILVVGGLVWMSQKSFSGGLPHRKKGSTAHRTTGNRQSAQQSEDMEAAEEVIPPLHTSPEEKTEEHTTVKYHESPQIPLTYGDTRIVAVARDPYWLFVYWEINETTKEDVRRRHGPNAWESARPVLKVYDTTNLYFFDSRDAVEIQINDFANNWYIHTAQPNHTYIIELGRILPDGTYIFIARSNMVTTPRDDISEIVDLEWLTPTEYEKRFYRKYGVDIYGSPSFVEGMAEHIKKEEENISSPLNW